MRVIPQSLALLAAAVLSFSALAQDNKINAVEQTVVINSPVIAVNPTTREVTLQIDGRPHTLKADNRVKNFDQIKVGDVLRVGYTQAIAIGMAPNATGRSSTTTTTPPTAAPKGDKPGVFASETVTKVARIEALNDKTQVVTLEGPNANYINVRVKDPAIFGKLKVGDFVEAVYSEAAIVEIAKP